MQSRSLHFVHDATRYFYELRWTPTTTSSSMGSVTVAQVTSHDRNRHQGKKHMWSERAINKLQSYLELLLLLTVVVGCNVESTNRDPTATTSKLN